MGNFEERNQQTYHYSYMLFAPEIRMNYKVDLILDFRYTSIIRIKQ